MNVSQKSGLKNQIIYRLPVALLSTCQESFDGLDTLHTNPGLTRRIGLLDPTSHREQAVMKGLHCGGLFFAPRIPFLLGELVSCPRSNLNKRVLTADSKGGMGVSFQFHHPKDA